MADEGYLVRDPHLFNELNNALGTMHYHRLVWCLRQNGYEIVRRVRRPVDATGWAEAAFEEPVDRGLYFAFPEPVQLTGARTYDDKGNLVHD